MLRDEYKNLKILYVEDEKLIRDNAVAYLKRLFKIVFEAKDAFTAVDIIKKNQPHIVVTDIKMSKLNGLDMIRQIRQYDKKTEFIVLTAFSDTKYLMDAIDLRLAKYLTKPIRHETFYPVLLNCAKTIFEDESNKKYLTQDCYYDMINEVIQTNYEIIKLSNYEIKFLKLLCKNPYRVVTYEEMQNIIWCNEYMSENAIRLLVRDLRKKLPGNCIKNLSKIGYKIELFK
jgi:DNA-binding response OmpR family regulator